MKNIPLSQRLLDKFWERVEKGDSCWTWKGSLLRKSGVIEDEKCYGQMYHSKKMYLAHRISYQIHNEFLDPKMLVCHKCDIPRCVNPEHLFMGTIADNNKDCANKGRNKRLKCKRGHELTPENSRYIKNGARLCRKCWLADVKMRRDKFISERVPNTEIKEMRLRAGLTMLQLGLEIGHSKSTAKGRIYDYESGRRRMSIAVESSIRRVLGEKINQQ